MEGNGSEMHTDSSLETMTVNLFFFLLLVCTYGLSVHVCECTCTRVHTRVPMSMWRSKVNTDILLHHSLSSSGRTSQSNPELADMANPDSLLRLKL